jgi:signal transduction histidine kinase/ActR/RegA family two-component response regulator
MQTQSPIKTSALRVFLLQGVFIIGFLMVFGLEQVFSSLIKELDQVSQNERARLFIGEQILRDIEAIEMNVYRMTIATGNNAHQRFENNINEHTVHLRHSLKVLRDGGMVSRTIYLNLDAADQMVKTVSYQPSQSKSYTMEIIELEPLIDQILEKTPILRELLEARELQRQQAEGGNMILYERQIKTYIKQIPPFFIRLKENANRLSYDTQQRLTEIEADLAAQRVRYEATKLGLMILVIISVILVGLVFARQINSSNRQLTLTWQEMLKAKEEADKASKAKSEFVSRMSHELRTPLNAILGFAQLLEMDNLPEHQKTPVHQINNAGKHLLELINQVLDIAKIEAGKLEIEVLSIDLASLLNDTFAISQERISNKGLSFNLNIDNTLPHYVMGDPTRLRQVLINLIGNAIKFTDTGSITLNAMPLPNQMVRFEVIDTGIGMGEQAQSRLFKAFAQADDSITRKYGGTGLGLMLCKEIVEALGGQISVVSEVGKGSCFWFELPLPPAESQSDPSLPLTAETAKAVQTPDRIEPAATLESKKILLVEDNPVNQMVASKFLQKLGITPDIANNGQEALDKLKLASYDLVLLDLEMPIMDGYTTISNIRKEENACDDYRHQLVIAMSANALNEDRQRAQALGIDDYITKPVNFVVLKTTLERWLLEKSADI